MILKKKAGRFTKFGRIIHPKIKKFRETSSTDRGHGSGRPRTVSTVENMNLIEELVCSWKYRPHTHLVARKIAEQTGISRSSIWRIVKKKNLKQFKHLKTPQTSEGNRNRRETCASSLRERFESNIRMIEKTVWQDEKDFNLIVNLLNDRVCWIVNLIVNI